MTDRYREHPVVTCHLMDGQLVPVHALEESDETVWFPLPPEPDASRVWEGLRAHRGENGETAQIRAVPLFAYDLNSATRSPLLRPARVRWSQQPSSPMEATTHSESGERMPMRPLSV